MDAEAYDDAPCCRIEFDELEFTSPDDSSPTGGAFGEIRFAKLRGVDVAVKKIKKQMTQRELDKVRFEVDILTQLRHPNVNLFMGICYDNEGKILIISERLKEDMEVVLRRIRRNLHTQCPELVGHVVIPTEPPLSQRMTWAKDAVKGLNWLHRNPSPVVHRDIKPANMLFCNHGTVKVCDFGLSRFEEEIQEEQNPVGTPIYMAPEILDQDRTYDERTDVYAFGITLWEIVTCLDALRQQGYKTMPQLKQAVQRRMQRPPIPDDAPKSLRDLLEGCWAPNPAMRPTFAEILQSMDTVIEECKEAECRQKIYEAAGGDVVASNFWFDMAGAADDVPWLQFKEAFSRFTSLHLMSPTDSPSELDLMQALEIVLVEERPGNNPTVTLKRWGEAMGWFGPLEPQETPPPPGFLSRVYELLTQEYFHGHVTAKQAGEKLARCSQGTYLVRFSANSYGCFVISVLRGTTCANFTVQRQDGKYSLPNGEQYGSISELLANEGAALGANQLLPGMLLGPATRISSMYQGADPNQGRAY